MATIFLSHSSRNDPLASKLGAWLKDNGFEDLFIDHDDVRTGDKWTEALRRAKAACRVVLCLVTVEWLESDECFGEFMAAWYAGRRVIPLLATAGASLTARQQKRLSRLLLEDQGADLSPAGAPEKLELDLHPQITEPLKAGLRAAGALVRIGLDPLAFDVDQKAQPEPFPGLASFNDTDADAAIFFGRSPEIARCLEDLREIRAMGDRRAYVIAGASGSGKSSLMKAGVLPRIRRERAWIALRVFRPGSDPLFSFAEAIARTAAEEGVTLSPGALRDDLFAAWSEKTALRAKLSSIVAPLRLAANRPNATVLVAIDQGEELAAAQGPSCDALCAYLRAALEEAKDGEAAPFAIVFTIRSDCFQQFEASRNLEGIETRVQNIRVLPAHRLAATIEEPAKRYGVEIEPQLVDALIADSEGQDALPLLAFALQRLWRQYRADGAIRKSHYEAMAKLTGLLEDAAERAMSGLDPLAPAGGAFSRVSDAHDARAASIFIPGLAQLSDSGTPIRRVADLSAFDDDANALLAQFAQWRLIVKAADTVEVAHEALFREWPRFANWLAKERACLETLRSLEAAALNWRRKARSRADLVHRGKRLAEAKALRRLASYRALVSANPDSTAYLEACEKIQVRNRLVTGAGAASIALVAASVISIPTILNQIAHAQVLRLHNESVARAQHFVPTSPILTNGAGAVRLRPGAVFRDCRDCPEMVVLPAGRFSMGSPDNQAMHTPDESPAHPVTVESLAMGRFDITFDDWAACVRAQRCQNVTAPVDYKGGGGRWPLIAVSFPQANQYAAWLSELTGQTYRLPSEAEWEYAARAGATSPFYTGSTISHEQANFGDVYPGPDPVGSYPPNAFGLYDMAGNVSQWVSDCFNPSYVGAPSDGSAWTTGACSRRIIRGGNYYMEMSVLRTANRSDAIADWPAPHLGFRVVRELK
ncbi:MAG TPA: SUMF1/EgtB/PvdO family nonheme iron enzyme [Caulobacteraceae bacterium]|jgi:formylglycine-generating enzyme required for sulfatase activity|nr:SUMF1/EgtB/PvdO family nonheme iron enzyme [Caulobacteraceae bacterium]